MYSQSSPAGLGESTQGSIICHRMHELVAMFVWLISPNHAQTNCREAKLSSETKTTPAFHAKSQSIFCKGATWQGAAAFLSYYSDMTLSGLHKIKCDKRESKGGIRLDVAPCSRALNKSTSYGNMIYSPV